MTSKFDLALGTIAPSLVGETESWKAPLARYAPRGGFEPLRRALAEKEAVEPSCVMVTSGASMALTASLAIMPKNRVVLMPRPYYPAYPNIAGFLGLDVVHYDIGQGRPMAEAVSMVTQGRSVGAILVNAPGNPMGNVASPVDMAELETIARRAEAVLLVDETYAGILLDPPANTWIGTGASLNIARIKSLSKAYLMAGERIGYVVAEPTLAREIEQAHWVMAMSPAVTAQMNAARALLEDRAERMPALCARLRRARDRAIAALADVPGIEFQRPTAGVFLWIAWPSAHFTGVDVARHCQERHGLSVMPGEACGQASPPAVRVSFALPETDVDRAFGALATALRELITQPRPTERRSAS